MTVLSCTRQRRRTTAEPMDFQMRHRARTASLLDVIGGMSDEDLAELDRYLRVYQRSGVGSLAGFVALK